jgi:single-strand DNA-binding protein
MTKEVELRYTANTNTAIAKFSLAVDTGYGENKKTSFLNMTAWGKTAEALGNNATKGTKLIIESQAVQNSYTDKNGNKVNTVDFNVVNFEFAESKNANANNNASAGQPQNNAPTFNPDGFMNIVTGNGEELPFS